MIFYLCNRVPERWKNVNRIEAEQLHIIVSPEERRERIAELLADPELIDITNHANPSLNTSATQAPAETHSPSTERTNKSSEHTEEQESGSEETKPRKKTNDTTGTGKRGATTKHSAAKRSAAHLRSERSRRTDRSLSDTASAYDFDIADGIESYGA
jgi:hypothetical protein